MLRRITALSLGLALLAGCGDETLGQSSGSRDGSRGGSGDGSSAVSAAISTADAEAAFATIADLEDAWKRRDCAKIVYLTTGAESTLGARVCEAARKGGAVPDLGGYGDAAFYLPGPGADRDQAPWFVALARQPHPAYFVFAQADGRWRLAAGPIPVVGAEPKLEGDVKDADDDPGISVRASLVPTRHVAYLTDPAGVSGVRFSSGDPMRSLLSELVRAPVKAHPDRLSTDVRLEGPARGLALPDGGALVFHALRVVYTQKPGSGRSSLAHPRYGSADVRAYTGESRPRAITGSELVLVATRVAKDNVMTTVAIRRGLADITSGGG
ncbi:hypothetical protein N5079_00990 [Planotetraspora sp. A-T 1434]|uniref:hypothetical protein n=1 Tax=Planotetraspora sp. A-T 1434 TaxID=2979219 RepID=UPI0021C1AB24|nr:hypothetical protein [Planotetraspora sp. A-T 1434]MCT9928787.1 hypothetical protein [Planotetraspora sp. A-T 1434]